MKVGINEATTSFTITPPGTAGQSQNFLIEAQFLEQGSGSTVLSYYNAANPAAPYSGPGNSGTPQYTSIIQRVALQLKAGAAAATGTQATPGADGGWVPLYVISVNNGQTQITSANITPAAGSPAIVTQLSQLPRKLMGPLTLYVSPYGVDPTGSTPGNSGLQPNDAFATINGAYSALLNNYNLNGQNVTISLAAGTFSGASLTGQPQGYGGGSSISIVGAGAGSTFISGGTSAALAVGAGANVTISNATFLGLNGIQANAEGTIIVGSGCAFGNCSGSLWWADAGEIFCANSITISGTTFTQGLYSSLGGLICFNGTCVVTFAGSATFTTFAAARGGQIVVQSGAVSFSGPSPTGQRYSAIIGGIIDTNGGGVNFLPGSTTGTTGSGTATGFYA
jgi:hypothetical protein